MRIAIAQMRVRAQNITLNLAEFREYISAARLQGAELLVCPEMCLPGYLVGDSWERRGFLLDIMDAHSAISDMCQEAGIAVVFGSLGTDPSRNNEDGRIRKFNALFVNNKGTYAAHNELALPFFPKTLSPNYREFDDSRHYFDLRKLWAEKTFTGNSNAQPAAQHSAQHSALPLCLVTLNGTKIGLTLCEDGWDKDYAHSPLLNLAQAGCDLLINASCSPFTEGKRKRRLELFSQKSAALKKPLLYVNCVGAQNVGKTVYGFDGSSLAFNSKGEQIFEGSFFEEELAIFDFEPATGELTFVKSNHHKQPNAEGKKVTAQIPHEPIFEKQRCLEHVLQCLCEEWKIARVVVGLSGGIDSALSAVIMARVLGPENVYCVNMPSRFNSQNTQNSALELATALGSPYLIAPIEPSLEVTLNQFQLFAQTSGFETLNTSGVVFENMQARDRGARLLAGLASALGAVFTCNANKSETVVGYSTLYGDLAGFLCPIADLWKHEVYAMALHYNKEIFQREVIPRAIFDVVPSAELSATQDVDKGMGDPLIYPYHDFLFRSWVEPWNRLCPRDILELYINGQVEQTIGCEQGLVAKLFPTAASFIADLERWWNCYTGMAPFKRVQAPPIIAVSRRAFGFDHRECVGPIDFGEKYRSLKEQLLSTKNQRT